MARYLYRALETKGTIQTGTCDAASAFTLRQTLHNQGLHLISAWRLGVLTNLIEAAPTPQAKADFFTHLETLVGAGFPLEEALSCFSGHKGLGRIGQHMAASLRAGKTLGEVFSAQNHVFDHTTSSMIAMAQRNGDLSNAFQDLALHWRWVNERRQESIKALIYPICLCVLVICLLTFLMDQVVPQLESFLTMTGHTPSFSARLLQTLCAHALEGTVAATIIALSLILFITLSSRASQSMALCWQRIFKGLPFFGNLWFEGKTYEMCHILGLMLKARIGLLEALEDLEKMTPLLLSKKLHIALGCVRAGKTLSQSFEKADILSPIEISMCALGEKTGRLDHFVLQCAHLIGERVKKRTRTFLALLEPGALMVVGALLIWIVTAVFLPLYEHLVMVEGL